MTPRFLAAFCALFVATAPAAAQSGAGGQVELGSFGIYTLYPNALNTLDDHGGAGGRLALHLSRVFSVEGNGDYTATRLQNGPRVRIARVGGTVLAHTRFIPRNTVYFGAGYDRTFYREALQGENDGIHLVLGDRLSLGGRAALRIEGRWTRQLSSSLENTTAAANVLAGSIGLSIYAFGGAPRDGDEDGIANNTDRCPDTPLGVTVDEAGCPMDTDADGVFDGPDQCADTIRGALVDSTGCATDEDSDGVVDGIDVCPNTPIGAEADANGCPTDADGDEVFDGLDACPDTPAGATVDAQGCPADDDMDGVLNGLDECPGTPADAEVDARGCTVERDSDDDGVMDGQDRCPGTRSGQQVDAVGCPILFEVQGGERRPLVLRGVTFASGRSTLTEESYATLDEVAASLVANSQVRIEIAGHTDATGSRQRNTELSLARALAVRAYLAQRGVAPDRMVARGYGPDQPIATNGTAAGRAQNRRVEISVLDDDVRQDQ